VGRTPPPNLQFLGVLPAGGLSSRTSSRSRVYPRAMRGLLGRPIFFFFRETRCLQTIDSEKDWWRNFNVLLWCYDACFIHSQLSFSYSGGEGHLIIFAKARLMSRSRHAIYTTIHHVLHAVINHCNECLKLRVSWWEWSASAISANDFGNSIVMPVSCMSEENHGCERWRPWTDTKTLSKNKQPKLKSK